MLADEAVRLEAYAATAMIDVDESVPHRPATCGTCAAGRAVRQPDHPPGMPTREPSRTSRSKATW
jgi:hypothetical protein